jgi:hypothetical protein
LEGVVEKVAIAVLIIGLGMIATVLLAINAVQYNPTIMYYQLIDERNACMTILTEEQRIRARGF